MPYRNFGFIPWQVIVGTVQAAALGSGSLAQKRGIDKYLKSQSRTVEQSHAQNLQLVQKELENKEKMAEIARRTEALRGSKIKQLTIISVSVGILITVVGLVSFYVIGGPSEK